MNARQRTTAKLGLVGSPSTAVALPPWYHDIERNFNHLLSTWMHAFSSTWMHAFSST